MLDKPSLEKFIEEKLAGSDLFLIDIVFGPGKTIKVEVDSDSVVDIDKCVTLTREIEESFAPDIEEYDLEVGSAGITSPLKKRRQFDKYIGKDMEVLTREGKKLRGMLKNVTDDGFTLQIEEKVKHEGAKRPVIEKVDHNFGYGDVKEVKYDLKF